MSPTPMPWSEGFHLPAWPPANGLTTINCPRNLTAFTVSASTHIYAPASIVWQTLRNTTAFPDWNTFTPSATVTQQSDQVPEAEQDLYNLGAKFTLQVVLDSRAPLNRTPSSEQVSDFSTPTYQSTYVPSETLLNDGTFYSDLSRVYRIAWGTDPDTEIVKVEGLLSERFTEIIPLDHCEGKKKGCEYRTWENYGGPPAPGIKQSLQTLLQEDFEIQARDLKKECERKAHQQQ